MVAALCAAFVCHAAQVDTLYLSHLYTTHISFETNLSYADISNPKMISALIPEQSKNILALKANEPFEQSASVTAIEESGAICVYVVVYREHPDELIIDARPKPVVAEAPVVQPVAPVHQTAAEPKKASGQKTARQPKKAAAQAPAQGQALSVSERQGVATTARAVAPTVKSVLDEKQSIFHVSDRQFGVKCWCENVLVYSDVVYVVLGIENGTGISYQTSQPTFMLESARSAGGRVSGRSVVSDGTIVMPKSTSGSLSVAPGASSRMSYCFDKLTLAKGQVLNIYVYETGGQRSMKLTLSAKDMNRAKSLGK